MQFSNLGWIKVDVMSSTGSRLGTNCSFAAWLIENEQKNRQTKKSFAKSFFIFWWWIQQLLLQPLIYWFLNHWAQCKSYNQHFILTVIVVCGRFIAKLVHLPATLSSLEKFSSFLVSLVLFDLHRLTRSNNAWRHSDQWISTNTRHPSPPAQITHGSD